MELRGLLARGERVRLEVMVRAATGAGAYRQVSAVIPGTDPDLPEVWVNAHDNYRNTGGANNLTGVGATIELSRALATLVSSGALPRPRRSIRFLWGAEHYSSIYNFFAHPERVSRVLAFLNVDMVGYHQERAKAVFHVYRTPHSLPHFLSDVAEQLLIAVGRANTESVREAGISGPGGSGGFEPLYAPTGSRDQLHYSIEAFWGPSDHEDVIALGVPAVLYNDWPDPYLGTQEDDIDRADPTQMRRAMLTIAATAYALAALTPERAAELTPLVANAAVGRMAGEASRAHLVLAETGSAPEALNLLVQSVARERRGLESLRAVGAAPALDVAVAAGIRHLELAHRANLETIIGKRAQPGMAATSAGLVPRRIDSIAGPVHFFRLEYGRAWMAVKLGADTAARAVPLARRGHYVLFEALNFADGRRTLSEIRDAVSAEYGPIPIEEIEQYFRFLDTLGVVTLHRYR